MQKIEVSLLCQQKVARTFVFDCVKYFSRQPEWDNISNFIDDIEDEKSVKVSKEGVFSLPGMFICTTEDDVKRRNSYETPRWFEEPFFVGGKMLFLSTQWCEDEKYRLTIPDLARLVEECFGNQYSIYKDNDGNWNLALGTPGEKGDESTKGKPLFSISEIITLIRTTGLVYDSQLIKRFAFSLMSKRFLILSGLAGSGKTQLALSFAKAIIEDDSQLCVVAVGSDWTNREPLLGFPNALQEGSYVKPDNGVLDMLIESNKEENADKPYFLVLDEMNMSYVERYFSDFLSAMESGMPIRLWNRDDCEVPKAVHLSKNIFIIGTINVDETTYAFSPKVLDRANVIEFRITTENMSSFLDEAKAIDRNSVNHKAAYMGEAFVKQARNDHAATENRLAVATLKEFFDILKSVNSEFGYRTATEIFRFILQAKQNDDTSNKMTDEEIVDCAIAQKLLPKLHGSRKRLESTFFALWRACFEEGILKETAPISASDVGKARFPITADKILRMYESALVNGFASFSEA